MRRSIQRCPATSAGAAAISASLRRSRLLRRRPEMRNYRVTHQAIIENVSRRNVLKGMVATGGLIIAAHFVPRTALAAYKTGADGMPGGTVYDPHVFVSIAPDGTVTIVAHRSEM